jgi:putative ABC transport system permease protein
MPLGSFGAPASSRTGRFAIMGRAFRPGLAEAVLALLVLLGAALLAARPGAEVEMRADVVDQRVSTVSTPLRALRASVIAQDFFSATPPTGDTSLTGPWRDLFGRSDVLLREQRAAAPEPLRGLLGEPRMLLLADGVDPVPPATGSDVSHVNLRTALSPDLAARVTLTSGREPKPRKDKNAHYEMLLSTASADRLDWKVGEARRQPPPGDGLGADSDGTEVQFRGEDGDAGGYRLVGTFSVLNPADPYWAALPSAAEPAIDDNLDRGITVEATAFVSPDDPEALFSLRPRFIGWFPVGELGTADSSLVAAQLRSYGSTIKDVGFGNGRFTSELTDVLEAVDRDVRTSRTLGDLLLSGPLTALLLGLSATAAAVAARRRPTLEVVRARGASGLQLRGVSSVAVLLITLPAAVVGAVVGLALQAGPGQVPTSAWLWPALIAVLPAAVAAALVPSHPALARRHTRPIAVLGGTVVLVAIGATVLALTGGLGPDDPLLLALPGLVAAAAAVVAVAVVRWGLPVALRSARRGRRAGVLVGGSRAARGGQVVATGLVALVVGLGIVGMTTTVLTTVGDGAREAAWQTTGADLRATGPDMTDERVAAVTALPGVSAAVPVMESRSAFVTIGGKRTAVRLFVADTDVLAQVQRATSAAGAGTPPLQRAPDGPLPVVASTDLVGALGGPTSARDGGVLTLQGGEARFDVVDSRATLPGLSGHGLWLLTDREALESRVDERWAPAFLLVDTDASLSGAATAELAAQVGQTVGTVAVRDRAAVVAERLGDATVAWLVRASIAGAALAVIVVLVALVSALGNANRARRHTLAVLLALRARPAEVRRTVTTELAGWMVPGTIVGLALGLGLGAVALALVDVAGLVGADQTPLAVSFAAIAALLLGVLALFLTTVWRQTRGLRRTDRGQTGRTDLAGGPDVAATLRQEEWT